MKLIDKDAVVAEIKRRIKEYQSTGDDYWFPVIENLKNILSLVDTLEVKEVDLKKEIDRELETRWRGEYLYTKKFRESAKHFFELGMAASNKAQKGEEV